MSRDSFGCHSWGRCHWHLLDRGHRCYYTNYNAKSSLPKQGVIWPQMSIVQKRNSPDLVKSHQSLCSKPPDVVPLFIKISYTLKMDHRAPHDLVSMKLYIFILFHSLPSILDTLSSEVFTVSAPNDSIPYSLIFQSPVSFLHGKPWYVILYLCFLLFQTIPN